MTLPSIKRKQLECQLQYIEAFSNPKAKFEQYITSPQITASILYDIQVRDGSLTNKVVADLGCGTGTFTIGTSLLGAQAVVGFEIDPDAIADALSNLEEQEHDSIVDLIQIDIIDLHKIGAGRWSKQFDTIVLNPPFGTSDRNKSIDMTFLETALLMAREHVYSLHKSTTIKHVIGKAESWGAKSESIARLKFDIPRTYSRHKRDSKDISVDVIHSWFH